MNRWALGTFVSKDCRGPAENKSYLWNYDLYTPYVMVLMRATPLRGQVRGGWTLEIKTFLGPVKWHRTIRRVPFGAQKIRDFRVFPYGPDSNSRPALSWVRQAR
jgi:hypothetical protein